MEFSIQKLESSYFNLSLQIDLCSLWRCSSQSRSIQVRKTRGKSFSINFDDIIMYVQSYWLWKWGKRQASHLMVGHVLAATGVPVWELLFIEYELTLETVGPRTVPWETPNSLIIVRCSLCLGRHWTTIDWLLDGLTLYLALKQRLGQRRNEFVQMMPV